MTTKSGTITPADFIAQIQGMPTPELIARLRAMNPPDPENMPPCPKWCTLEAGHKWDSERNGRLLRGHQGPFFGLYVSVGCTEYADRIGTHYPEVDVQDTVTGNVDSPMGLREFAEHVLAAADWIEAQP